MTPPDLEARFRVAEKLQSLLTKHHPGSHRSRVIERALDLVFNERRAGDVYLIRNLLRDAERIMLRQARAGLIVSLSAEPGDRDYPGDLDAYMAENAHRPDLLLEAKQLAQAIVNRTSARSQSAARIFEGLVLGESIQATAEDCGLSPARVNQVRREIRFALVAEVGAGNVH